MNITTDYDTLTFNFTEDCFLEFRCDWLQIFGKYNWYSFHLLTAYLENDKWTGGIEGEVWVLGFGVRVRFNYDPSKLDDMRIYD